MEELIPKGMIFWGPPGTGKTLFAKAMATEIGAAITIVSGPELKSKWVGESEENLRQIFHKARQSAPSIIVFDELDSFASARGTYTGCGVEHSMVNQLLTEMDGFHREEMVFVVGTTNFVENPRPGPAAARPLRVPPAHPLSGRRGPPRDPQDLRQEDGPEDAAGDAGTRRRSHRPHRARRRGRHAVQRRPPQRPVPGHRPQTAARRTAPTRRGRRTWKRRCRSGWIAKS